MPASSLGYLYCMAKLETYGGVHTDKKGYSFILDNRFFNYFAQSTRHIEHNLWHWNMKCEVSSKQCTFICGSLVITAASRSPRITWRRRSPWRTPNILAVIAAVEVVWLIVGDSVHVTSGLTKTALVLVPVSAWSRSDEATVRTIVSRTHDPVGYDEYEDW